MIDLHCHILSGLDDGASDLNVSLKMARMLVADGVEAVACTPHILPGLYHNDADEIRAAVDRLRSALIQRDIRLDVVCGSDAHMAPDFIAKLKNGQILALADSRYVLVEPPNHVAPAQLEQFFFEILVAGYVPVLTHPERLTWIGSRYSTIERLARAGVWMQITAGSLTGNFGRNARYWAERMLDEGYVHILATDAHDTNRRPPDLARGWEAAAKRAGDVEAGHLVLTRPRGVLQNATPSNLPSPYRLESIRSPKSA
jgi:protein-tyrosine phosphatase